MPGSKKDRKHGKEVGGIAAAVTRQTAGKFSQGNGSDSALHHHLPASNALPPLEVTPGPDADSQLADWNNDHDEASNYRDVYQNDKTAAPNAPSPLLDALSATSVSVSTAPSMANDWARAAVGTSPSNPINLSAGESPPTQPSSYEDSARLRHGWPAHRPFALSSSPASASPPRSSRRPLSFQIDAQYNNSGPASLSAVSTAAPHRSPIHTNHTAHRVGYHSSPAHKGQTHFYGAQDLDLTITPQTGSMKAGDSGFFFGLDTLPLADGTASSKNVVLAGYEGGLKVYTITKRGIDLLVNFRGLHGGVYYAKVLPWTVRGAAGEAPSPLIALVIHGPVLSPRPGDDLAQPSHAAHPSSSARASPMPSPEDVPYSNRQRGIVSYQTSVQVFCLKTHKCVDILLRAPEIAINGEVSLKSSLFHAPPPSGAFAIKADAGTLAVCSGVTGECWLFRQLDEAQDHHGFACSGKLWTTLHQSIRNDVPEEMDRARLSASTPRASVQRTPVFDLGGRWIAYCPAAASSQIALGARIMVPVLPRAPGVNSQTPPHPPSPMATTDESIADSMVNRLMRETTQELIQGAKWVGQQSLQAWNSYWNKSNNSPQQSQPQQQAQQKQTVSSPPRWSLSRTPQADGAHFPPTHGAASQPVAKQPGVVSIVDTETLANSSSIHPLTVFCPSQGCSFLSFSPSGLNLFTASVKGDVQDVWDLLRIQYTHSSVLQSTLPNHDSTGPLVRQIAHFTRMTVARVVEVAWTEPHGQRLAVVTERGTVHVLDMPFSAFLWPALRRRKVESKTTTDSTEAATSAVSIASGALGAAYQAARPFVTRSRRSSAATPATPGHSLRDSAAQGGRAIAAGISQSLGKTGTAISQWRNAAESRVSLPIGSTLPATGCVTWLKTRKSWILVSIGGGNIRMFPRGIRRRLSSASRARFASEAKHRDIQVPPLPNDSVAPIVRQIMDMGVEEEFLELSDIELEAGNTMTLKPQARTGPSLASLEDAIPHAEIESSAPYQPFHTDRRVVIGEYKGTIVGISLPQRGTEPMPAPLDNLAQARPVESSPAPDDGPAPAPVAEATPVLAHVEPAANANSEHTPVVDKTVQDAPTWKRKKKKAQGAASSGQSAAAKAEQSAANAEKSIAKSAAALEEWAIYDELPPKSEPSAAKPGKAQAELEASAVTEYADHKATKPRPQPRPQPQAAPAAPTAWAFGQDIPFTKLNTGQPQGLDYEEPGIDDNGMPLAMERVMDYGDSEEIVVTTRRSRSSRQGEGEDGFFEDDCEVWDFADQRV
ncbi:hypothetical protein CDD82_3845 [Ophiocordyceps australis]|uniref:BCAS3 domain-containing protein n=1 Tax=Ophiocordyceps australis TaxID=1399860 RepID=A0A2C5ZT97_9HYPO|nr:hypothetical protein CDD82_3845 [Ophiocordyceps australis]